ncbi:unnamed protein product [Caenorhabditis sp. 36 PRJEB53466]|nr:unnamed protein product [Caenorhabditis sp. 36 PRJEB53466]
MAGNNRSNWHQQRQSQQIGGFPDNPPHSSMDGQSFSLLQMRRSGPHSVSTPFAEAHSQQQHMPPYLSMYQNDSSHSNYILAQQSQRPFIFNANAHTFVPRNGMQQYSYHHDGYNMHSRNYYDQEQPGNQYLYQNFGPTVPPAVSLYNSMYSQDDACIDAFAQFGQQSQQYMPSTELSNQMQHSRSSSLLNEILVGCEQLLSEGNEDSSTWISAIRQRFENQQMDEESKKVGVKLIVEMAHSMEPNQFRGTDPQYTFSTLLKTLADEVKDFMRKAILPVLSEFHESRSQLENSARVFMAVFYAEVFVKLTLDNGSRFEKLGQALSDQIDDILKFPPKDENMKYLLRAFKVAGAELDFSEELRKRVDQILTVMGGFANGSPVLGESIKAQIMSLIDCRQRGWDRVRPVNEPAPVSNRYEDSFDESTDNDLTEEERQFLESHLEQAEKNDDGDEIDEQEVMNEFGKFVKEELWRAEEIKTTEMMTNLAMKESGAADNN